MKIYIERKWKKVGYTIGQLWVNGQKFCHTLEPEDCGLDRESNKVDVALAKVKKGMGKVAIPTGIYRVHMYPSRRFRRMLPHVEGVTGFEGILIHSGNTKDDTQGCILVGENREVGRVLDSRKWLNLLITQIMKAEEQGEPVVLQVV